MKGQEVLKYKRKIARLTFILHVISIYPEAFLF